MAERRDLGVGRARRRTALMAMMAMTAGLLALTGQAAVPAAAVAAVTVTSVRGEACGYISNVGLFGGPQAKLGCEPQMGTSSAPATADTRSPSVALPPEGSATALVATDPDGAKGKYGPAVIFGGRWPANVADPQPSGPITTRAQGTPAGVNAGGAVTSSADIDLYPTPVTVECSLGFNPPCTAPGGFGPFPVEGDSLHVECTATATGVSGSTKLTNAVLATSTDPDGAPKDQERVPDNPPVNYTRHGVISNVGDVFSVVYNEHVVNADGSLTVNGAHMYLFGPIAVGEVIKGQATCGTTPATLTPSDTQPPTCGPLVVQQVSPDDPTPTNPRRERIGVFDAGGLQSITNVQATNATVQVGQPDSANQYLRLTPGQTGPLPVVAIRTDESLPMQWSFDATDVAGNTTHCGSGGVAGTPGLFHGLAPSRILDTRTGTGGFSVPVGPAATIAVPVAGHGGVPATGASAVVLNVTVTQPTSAGFLTVFPDGDTRPNASSLNFVPGQDVPNLVVAKLGADGKVAAFNSAGTTHVIFDVTGWFSDSTGSAGARYNTLAPARILDTRTGTGGFSAPVGPAATISPTVVGVGGVPAGGVSAVVLNVTVTQPSAAGFLTVFPNGDARPNASNLNFVPGQDVPNLVVAKVGTDGKVAAFNSAGSTHVIFDVVGWYGTDGATTGARFNALSPARILDTRTGTGGFSSPVGPAATISPTVVGVGGVPANGVSAVVLNVTVTQPTAAGFLTVFPNGETRPNASNLNFVPGQDVPNLVIAKVGADGKVAAFNGAGATHVIFDVVGWYGA